MEANDEPTPAPLDFSASMVSRKVKIRLRPLPILALQKKKKRAHSAKRTNLQQSLSKLFISAESMEPEGFKASTTRHNALNMPPNFDALLSRTSATVRKLSSRNSVHIDLNKQEPLAFEAFAGYTPK